MPSLITPVILSGGSGTRLWPLSVPERPKQFIPLLSDDTMFAETLARVSDRTLFHPPLIVGAQRHASLITAEQHGGTILFEPCPRGTAPAIALAALEAGADESLLLVLSSDHSIGKLDAFLEGIKAGAKAAAEDWLVCLGIEPTYPETGYGYIELGNEEIAPHVKKVSRFVEKPAQETAQRYVDGGKHVWNAGIFLFRADQILKALEIFDADLYHKSLESWQNARREDDIVYPEISAFESIKSGAIDTVVMERATNVACAPVDMGWSDVGSWDALYELANKTPEGNALSGDVTAIECENILVHGDNISVATYGVSDLIIVATHKGVIVLPRGQSQSVKTLHDIACRS